MLIINSLFLHYSGPANRSSFLGLAVTFYTELGDLPEMVRTGSRVG